MKSFFLLTILFSFARLGNGNSKYQRQQIFAHCTALHCIPVIDCVAPRIPPTEPTVCPVGRVTLPGFKGEEAADDVIASSDLFVITSRTFRDSIGGTILSLRTPKMINCCLICSLYVRTPVAAAVALISHTLLRTAEDKLKKNKYIPSDVTATSREYALLLNHNGSVLAIKLS